MRHHFLDHYWTIESPIHRVDPRFKIIVSFMMLLSIVLTPNSRFIDYALFAPLIATMIIVSKIPIGAVLRRMMVIIPLVCLIAVSLPFTVPGPAIAKFHFIIPLTLSETGLTQFAAVVIKATLAVWIMTLLTTTTRFRDLIAGMQKLHLPSIFTSILGFMYRYIFLFIDEAEHINIGRASRSFGRHPWLKMKGFGWMLSSLFVRSFERGERIYQAMCARGFEGDYQTLTIMRATTRDWIFSIILVACIILIKWIGYFHG